MTTMLSTVYHEFDQGGDIYATLPGLKIKVFHEFAPRRRPVSFQITTMPLTAYNSDHR
ncbi:hypothetical protein B4135_2075 [Caldibacillus debilis]|uniref:Uncharacterized protein n=1 Tax=Caldibacillus debilis TaxID=301148 RepID=A0A150M412_9BACI|nr:hypothetical protein B4135_2075 [Caldibacillus debilis]